MSYRRDNGLEEITDLKWIYRILSAMSLAFIDISRQSTSNLGNHSQIIFTGTYLECYQSEM